MPVGARASAPAADRWPSRHWPCPLRPCRRWPCRSLAERTPTRAERRRCRQAVSCSFVPSSAARGRRHGARRWLGPGPSARWSRRAPLDPRRPANAVGTPRTMSAAEVGPHPRRLRTGERPCLRLRGCAPVRRRQGPRGRRVQYRAPRRPGRPALRFGPAGKRLRLPNARGAPSGRLADRSAAPVQGRTGKHRVGGQPDVLGGRPDPRSLSR